MPNAVKKVYESGSLQMAKFPMFFEIYFYIWHDGDMFYIIVGKNNTGCRAGFYQMLISKSDPNVHNVHLACASHARCKFFLTCDEELIKYAKKLSLEIKVMNPVEYIREAE
ncbi:MAG: hypothetical protein HY759_04825 [Nitrospirae bacterium]|nr:hypothetical protein [Nitrospirota bacterium]